uniref:Uncharacterized protein n=1 Tax=Arundo donax TaxID=35708 RepID=A0A0A9GTW8_ARUDO
MCRCRVKFSRWLDFRVDISVRIST